MPRLINQGGQRSFRWRNLEGSVFETRARGWNGRVYAFMVCIWEERWSGNAWQAWC